MDISEIKEAIRDEFAQLQQITLIGIKDALTMDDVCLLTNLSKSYLYKLVSANKIPHYKSDGGSKLTYFDKDEVKKWCLANRISTIEETTAKAVSYCQQVKKGVKNGK